MRIWKYFFLFIILSYNSFGQGLKTNGDKIVDQNGNEVILRGMGLGGWMLMEGYMMQSSDVADTQHEFRERLIELIGTAKTDEFFDSWHKNHVTKADIDSLASWGFNSVRLPMHYNLFTLPIQDEPISGENTWLEKGFTMVDELLDWCKSNEMYLILDLHAAPGGQGANAAISDYDSDLPSLWESNENKSKTVALWKKLAERYKSEAWLGGYDLLNEVNWTLENENEDLRLLYEQITDSIRSVDTDHIIFIEGNGFANDFRGLTPPWDDNMVYSFHKYWSTNNEGSIDWVLKIREEHNVPLWMGESGENSNVWFRDAIKLFEDNKIGWSWWPMKRIETIVAPYSIKFSDGYKSILNYWRGNISKPSVDKAYSIMMDLAASSNSLNCDYQKDVHDAQIRQVATDETIPFKNHEIPGVINMSDYDMGRSGYAYYDVDDANYQLSSGNFQAWNSGWVYRNDGVDIEKSTDTTNLKGNGYHLGFVNKGEWINYTVDVKESGVYSLYSRMAALDDGGKFQIEIDDEPVTSSLSVSSTGDWNTFKTLQFDNIILEEGEHVLSFHTKELPAFNISTMEFSRISDISDIDFILLEANTSENNSEINILLNNEINPESVEKNNPDFSLNVNNQIIEIDSLTIMEGKKRTFKIHFSEKLSYGDIISVGYSGNSIKTNQGNILKQFSNFRVKNLIAKIFQIPGKIESEQYSNMFGVEIENTTDIGGGSNIGYTNGGDYVDYKINVSSNLEYDIKLRVAAESNSGRVVFYSISPEQTETELATMLLPITNGWQNWQTVSGRISLKSGEYTLRMKIINGDFNLNWIDISYKDSDGDGVNDQVDECPDSLTDVVDEKGCELSPIPSNIFIIKASSETCNSSNNGSISITSSQQENFIAYLNQNLNTQKQFTSNTTFDNLSSGIYELCIALSEFPKVKQCFTVRVKQPADLLVSSSVNAISYTISFELNGANKYYIKLNDKYYTTDKTRIELPITKEINEIEVSTDIECQGTYEETIRIENNIKIYPNPVDDENLNIDLGINRESKSTIQIFDVAGNLIYSGQVNKSTDVDFSNFPKGLYILKIIKDQNIFNYKIIK